MTNGSSGMVGEIPQLDVFKEDYEMKLFCNLSKALKEKVVTIDKESISISDVNPLSLVCIEISENPGITPFIIGEQNTTFDLFKKLAEQRGFSIKNFHDALKRGL